MMNTRLGWMSSRSVINSTGMEVKRGRTLCSMVATVLRWLTMTIATPMSAGSCLRSRM